MGTKISSVRDIKSPGHARMIQFLGHASSSLGAASSVVTPASARSSGRAAHPHTAGRPAPAHGTQANDRDGSDGPARARSHNRTAPWGSASRRRVQAQAAVGPHAAPAALRRRIGHAPHVQAHTVFPQAHAGRKHLARHGVFAQSRRRARASPPRRTSSHPSKSTKAAPRKTSGAARPVARALDDARNISHDKTLVIAIIYDTQRWFERSKRIVCNLRTGT